MISTIARDRVATLASAARASLWSGASTEWEMSEREKVLIQRAAQMRQTRMQQKVNDLKNELRRLHRFCDEAFGPQATPSKERQDA